MLRQTFSIFERPLTVAAAQAVSRRPLPNFPLLSSLSSRPYNRAFSSSPWTHQENNTLPSDSASQTPPASPPSQTHIALETPEPKLSLTFTCTVEACHTRSTHQFTKRSYQKGIVLVQCPGCKNR